MKRGPWLGSRTHPSVTVTYASGDLRRTAVGMGHTFGEALLDADERLREHCRKTGLAPSDWTRVCVSTPQTIYADLQGRKGQGRSEHPTFPGPVRGERTVIHVV